MKKAVRDALIAFMAALGQAQAEATKLAQQAGIAHAQANGNRVYLGRKRTFNREPDNAGFPSSAFSNYPLRT